MRCPSGDGLPRTQTRVCGVYSLRQVGCGVTSPIEVKVAQRASRAFIAVRRC